MLQVFISSCPTLQRWQLRPLLRQPSTAPPSAPGRLCTLQPTDWGQGDRKSGSVVISLSCSCIVLYFKLETQSVKDLDCQAQKSAAAAGGALERGKDIREECIIINWRGCRSLWKHEKKTHCWKWWVMKCDGCRRWCVKVCTYKDV